MLEIDPRPLQRRIDSIKQVLRDSLVTRGVGLAHVEENLRSVDNDAAMVSQTWWQVVFADPSR